MIETDRLILRAWRDTDRAPMAEINANPKVMEFLGPPRDRAASDAGIDRMIAMADAGKPCFMAAELKADQTLIGFIGLMEMLFNPPFGPGYEIGWRLAPKYWGAGYASEGARSTLQYGFTTLRLNEIFSFTALGNTRSQAVMKRIGMVRVEGGDFDHPRLAPEDPFCRHVLYKIENAQ